MMRIDILTLFPEMFEGMFSYSIIKRARDKGIADINLYNIRDWSVNRHRTVDDYPYGGGGGMVMLPEPFFRFHDDLTTELGRKPYVVMLSARGRPFRQDDAKRLAALEQVTLFCGHYKGIDGRVDELADEEISLGDFVVSGGEVPAMAVVDAVCRLLPGAVGAVSSITSDSFYEGILGPPEYTRPEVFRGRRVPDVLVGGNHARIDAWRRDEALRITRERRPDLLTAAQNDGFGHRALVGGDDGGATETRV